MSRTSTLYEALGGLGGVLQLAEAWHQRVLADEIVAHAFRHGFHPQHTERLAAYWAEAWGGPTTYSEQYGNESSVARMHSGNGPHEEMDRRAIACFDQAMDDIGITDPELRRVLHDYFAWATTTNLANHEGPSRVPDGLRNPSVVVGRTPGLTAFPGADLHGGRIGDVVRAPLPPEGQRATAILRE